MKIHSLSFSLEQGTGVEPALTAWEAAVIPIYQPCVFRISFSMMNAMEIVSLYNIAQGEGFCKGKISLEWVKFGDVKSDNGCERWFAFRNLIFC